MELGECGDWIEKASRVIPLDGGVSNEFLRELLGRFDEVMRLGDIHDRRTLLSHVVDRIELGERHGRSRARSLVAQAARLPPVGMASPEPLDWNQVHAWFQDVALFRDAHATRFRGATTRWDAALPARRYVPG